MTEPTDAELDMLIDDVVGLDSTDEVFREFARAVLRRWGQPSGAGPLTPEAINAMAREYPAEDLCGWSYRMGVADAEALHGIKGGQHER